MEQADVDNQEIKEIEELEKRVQDMERKMLDNEARRPIVAKNPLEPTKEEIEEITSWNPREVMGLCELNPIKVPSLDKEKNILL